MTDVFGGFLRALKSSPPPFRKVLCRDCGLSYEEVNPTPEQAKRRAVDCGNAHGRCPRCASTLHQFVEHLHRDDGRNDATALNHSQPFQPDDRKGPS